MPASRPCFKALPVAQRLSLLLLTDALAHRYGQHPAAYLTITPGAFAWDTAALDAGRNFEEIAARRDSKGTPVHSSARAVFAELLARHQSPDAMAVSAATRAQNLRRAQRSGLY